MGIGWGWSVGKEKPRLGRAGAVVVEGERPAASRPERTLRFLGRRGSLCGGRLLDLLDERPPECLVVLGGFLARFLRGATEATVVVGLQPLDQLGRGGE